jgi:hypothetical protein
MPKFEQVEYDPYLAQLRSLTGDHELSTAWTEGRALTMEQAIQFALN